MIKKNLIQAKTLIEALLLEVKKRKVYQLLSFLQIKLSKWFLNLSLFMEVKDMATTTLSTNSENKIHLHQLTMKNTPRIKEIQLDSNIMDASTAVVQIQLLILPRSRLLLTINSFTLKFTRQLILDENHSLFNTFLLVSSSFILINITEVLQTLMVCIKTSKGSLRCSLNRTNLKI